ncbi:MAG: hypothetical protein D3907_09440 [Candidatus Electrothrix sp. AUS3]|nr:hypothetical protein [Candidatus Electrothrix gigas]
MKPKAILITYILMILNASQTVAYNINIYESEPNGTKTNATLLPYDYTIKRGNISSLDDSDWYKIDISQPSSLTIKFDHPRDGYQYNLFLVKIYNSNDVLLSQRTIYAADETTTFDVGLGESGSYYIVVSTACQSDTDRCEYHRSDEYNLTISVFNTDDYLRETEPNNSMVSADSYVNGGIITGQISTISDEDFFVITTNSPADILVNFSHPVDSYQYNIFYAQILDSNGQIINSTDIYAPDEFTNFGFSVATAGNYYLKITGCQSGNRCEIHGTDQYMVQTLISPLDTGSVISPPCPDSKSGFFVIPVCKNQ